ncbi:MAG: tetratricopeptide (TPR) repeat protein [Granulosicoccus sp.]
MDFNFFSKKQKVMKRITFLFFSIVLLGNIQAQSIDELNDKANQCFAQGEFDCCVKTYKKMIKKYPKKRDKSRLYCDMGTAYRRMGKTKDAMKAYNKAIKLNSKKADYFTNRATLKHNLEDVKGALADYNAALELDDLNKTARINRGMMMYIEFGELDKAQADLNAYLKVNPDDIDVEARVVTLIKKQGKMEEAIVEYSKLIKKYPESAMLYNARSDTYLGMKKLDEAMIDVEKSIELDPNYVIAQVTKGEVFMERGNMEEACKQFNLAVELGIDKRVVKALLAKCK